MEGLKVRVVRELLVLRCRDWKNDISTMCWGEVVKSILRLYRGTVSDSCDTLCLESEIKLGGGCPGNGTVGTRYWGSNIDEITRIYVYRLLKSIVDCNLLITLRQNDYL